MRASRYPYLIGIAAPRQQRLDDPPGRIRTRIWNLARGPFYPLSYGRIPKIITQSLGDAQRGRISRSRSYGLRHEVYNSGVLVQINVGTAHETDCTIRVTAYGGCVIMGYEIFTRKIRRVGSPQISFMRNGRMSFNKAGTVLLQEQAVEQVLLLWDQATRRIGIRPIIKQDPRAYKVHFGHKNNAAGFSAVTFMEHAGIDCEKGTQSYPVEWNQEQGVFEVKLTEQIQERQPLLTSLRAQRE